MLIGMNQLWKILTSDKCFLLFLGEAVPGSSATLGFCRAKRIAFGATLAERNAQPQVSNAKT